MNESLGEDLGVDLAEDERALLATARHLASSLTPAEKAVFDAASAALEEGRVVSHPAPKSRPRLTLKCQEECLRLAAELGYIWDSTNPVNAGEQVCRVLREAIDAEKVVREWLRDRGRDFLRGGGLFRVLAPLLKDNLSRPTIFLSPSVARMFASLLYLMNHEDEPRVFEDVVRVLMPPSKGKRKPFVQRSRDEAAFAEFQRQVRNLRWLERRTRDLTLAEDIHAVASRAAWESPGPSPPSEHADAVARYRTRRNRLSLRQLAALIWKQGLEISSSRSIRIFPYEKTALATLDDAAAKDAEREADRLKERLKGERRRAVSRRKRTSN